MKISILIVNIFFAILLKAQLQPINVLITKLDSVVKLGGKPKPFASLYYKSILKTNEHLIQLPIPVQNYIISFEQQFAPLFFSAADAFNTNKPMAAKWKDYFEMPILNEMQYQFIGLNIHINGDMWYALQQLHYDSIVKYRKDLETFQGKFDEFWDSTYATALQYKKINRIHQWTLGLPKLIGKKMIKKWRYRSIRIALLYTKKPKKYKRKVSANLKKMHNWNKRALRWIK